MTTALIVLAVLAVTALVAALWNTIRTGGGGSASAPRHAESDWASPFQPSQPYNRIPRLP